MKIKLSVSLSLLLLLTLVGCGSEEFGTTPQSTTSTPDAVSTYSQLSCSSHTLIKPKVDILYVVDNSGSAFYFSDDIKKAITNTVNKVSQQFDYRLVGTTLIPDSTPYNDYQVLTNSTDALPDSSKKIISSSELTFFQNPGGQYESEKGLRRTINFINGTGGLFRQNAYLLVILVSNGRDMEVEKDPNGDGMTVQNLNAFNARVNSFNAIKTNLNLTQLRFISVTAKANECKPGWRRSTHSYVAMASTLPDGTSYDLCTDSVANIFTQVNSSIQQQIIPHQYRYFPMTFAKSTDTRNSFGEIEVFKSNGNSAPVKMNSGWAYHLSSNGFEDTRELPTMGERVYAKHFIRFDNLITYPDCIQIKSTSRTEYFKFIVLPKEPKTSNPPITVTINGQIIPESSTNGWTYRGNISVPTNIKAEYPNAGDDQPAIMKSGFMIELRGPSNYYKSGDNVQVNYVPAVI